jgi:hypothetical protein
VIGVSKLQRPNTKHQTLAGIRLFVRIKKNFTTKSTKITIKELLCIVGRKFRHGVDGGS